MNIRNSMKGTNTSSETRNWQAPSTLSKLIWFSMPPSLNKEQLRITRQVKDNIGDRETIQR